MKIRSAVPKNRCLVFLWRMEKTKKTKDRKNKKTSVKHIRIRLIGGCLNYWPMSLYLKSDSHITLTKNTSFQVMQMGLNLLETDDTLRSTTVQKLWTTFNACLKRFSIMKLNSRVVDASAAIMWPWPSTFWSQNLISSPLSQDASVTKVWRKSVNRYWRYCGNIVSDAWTEGRTEQCKTHGLWRLLCRQRRLKNIPVVYTVSQKKEATKLLAVTLSNLNQI